MSRKSLQPLILKLLEGLDLKPHTPENTHVRAHMCVHTNTYIHTHIYTLRKRFWGGKSIIEQVRCWMLTGIIILVTL